MCEHIKTPNGGEFIICGLRSPARRCVHCGLPGVFLCDWKVKGRRSGTCDRAMCAKDVREVAPGKHLCREHSRAWDDWQRLHSEQAARILVRRQPEQMSLL
jgi:hypothetical protein